MKANEYIRAWKDPDYRASLSAEQRAALPAHPCAEVELSDEMLEQIAGAATGADLTAGCCATDWCFTVIPCMSTIIVPLAV